MYFFPSESTNYITGKVGNGPRSSKNRDWYKSVYFLHMEDKQHQNHPPLHGTGTKFRKEE